MSEEVKKIKVQGGNDYITVNERVKEFHRKHENGSIVTEIIEMTDRFITMTKVTPNVDSPDRYFTGIAYEKEGNSFINKSSALENCETSSVGRAIGLLGIGIDTSIASYDEVENAKLQQKDSPIQKAPKLKDINIKNPKAEENIKKHEESINLVDIADKVLTPPSTGIHLDDDIEWTGDEVCRFGKYKDVPWKKIVDGSWITWVATSSKVDWQRDLANKELKRRGTNV